MLNGVAFLLIGLQLRFVISGIRQVSVETLALSAAVVVTVVILLRLAWVFAEAYLLPIVRRKLLAQAVPAFSLRGTFVVGWTGMRGVVSLAAALSLPETLNSGQPFPLRNMIIFLTFCVIFVTLVLQGLTLPALIRKLRLTDGAENSSEEQKARRKIVNSALERLAEMRSHAKPEFDAIYEHIAKHYQARLAANGNENDGAEQSKTEAYKLYRDVMRKLREVERSTALKLRNENEISDALLHRLELELDLLDVRYRGLKR
jgi:monovalent cation/hydrogen antiporter